MKTKGEGARRYKAVAAGVKEKLLRGCVINLLLVLLALNAFAQSKVGQIKVDAVNEETKEMMPFAKVKVLLKEKLVMGSATNLEGVCVLKDVPEGKYDLIVGYLGFEEIKYGDVIIADGQTTYLHSVLKNKVIMLEPLVFTDYQVPLIDCDCRIGCSFGREYYCGGGSCTWWEEDSLISDTIKDADPTRGTLAKHSTVLLYPNPTNGVVNVEARGYMEDILLFDMNGRMVEKYSVKGKTTKIDLGQYQEGTYILRYPEKGTWNADKLILIRN